MDKRHWLFMTIIVICFMGLILQIGGRLAKHEDVEQSTLKKADAIQKTLDETRRLNVDATDRADKMRRLAVDELKVALKAAINENAERIRKNSAKIRVLSNLKRNK